VSGLLKILWFVFGNVHNAAIYFGRLLRTWWRRNGFAGIIPLFPVKLHHAIEAHTAFVSELLRNLSDKFFRDFDFRAPAGTFVRGDGAKLAIVWLPAQRASSGVE
jgi:hypothetical protein